MHELLLVRGDHARHVWVSISRSYLSVYKLSISSREAPETNPLVPHLLVDPEDDRGVCHEFLNEAISRFEEDDSVRAALVGAVEDLSRQLAKLTMNDNYKPYIFVNPTIDHSFSFQITNTS